MSKHINEIEVDDKTFRDDKNISEAFNEFFTNIGPKLASEVTNMTINSAKPIWKTMSQSSHLFVLCLFLWKMF